MISQRQVKLSILALAASAATLNAQVTTTRSAVALGSPDTRQVVTSVLLREGRLGLIGSDASRVAFMPTSILKSEFGVTIVSQDGRITELAGPSAAFGLKPSRTASDSRIDETALKAGPGVAYTKIYVRYLSLARDGSVLAFGGTVDGSTRDPVNRYTIPNGTYSDVAGKSIIVSFTNSRPASFLLPGTTQGIHEVNEQPVPIAAPIRR